MKRRIVEQEIRPAPVYAVAKAPHGRFMGFLRADGYRDHDGDRALKFGTAADAGLWMEQQPGYFEWITGDEKGMPGAHAILGIPAWVREEAEARAFKSFETWRNGRQGS